MTGAREFTGAECASAVGVSIKTWYAWIKAGVIRAAPIVRPGGPGRGGRRVRWTSGDIDRGRRVRELTAQGVRLSEVSQKLRRP